MNSKSCSRAALTLGVVLLAALDLSAATRGGERVEIANWPVPSLSIVANVASSASNFVSIDPCRVVDTRLSNGAYGSPALATATPRTFNISAGPCSGIPVDAAAVSLNFTVTGSPSGTSYHFITAYPTGTSRPTASTLNFRAGAQQSGAAIVRANAGSIDVYSSLTTDLIVDVNGYFTADAGAVPQYPIAFDLGANGFSAWLIGSASDYQSGNNQNASIVLQRGLTYQFKIGVSGHAFRIASTNGGAAYTVGVTNNDAQSGTVTFKVPMDAPATLAYYCLFHSAMNGTITIP